MARKKKRIPFEEYEPTEEQFWDDVERTGNPRFSGTSFWGEYNRQERAMTEHDDGLGAYRDADEDKDSN